jgi:bifunctional enzyme CysN/CysC
VDAHKRLTAQSCRHAYIVSLLGIRHVLPAVNKIDLIQHDHKIRRDLAIPLSAQFDDNVCLRSHATSGELPDRKSV